MFTCGRTATDTRASLGTATLADAALLPLRTAINAKEIGARANYWEWEKAGKTDNLKNATRMEAQSLL